MVWPAIAAAAPPGINLNLDSGDGEVSTSLQILALITVLSLAPSILIMMTSFTRIIIVLGFVRNALGTPSMPPNQVLVGVALFLSLFVMGPTFTQINNQALQPLLDHKINEETALKRAEAPIRDFMFKQVDQKDLALFTELSKSERPATRADVPTRRAHPRVRALRAEDRVRDRVPDPDPVPGDRHGGGVDRDEHGHGDAAPCGHLAPVQDPAVRAGRRLSRPSSAAS